MLTSVEASFVGGMAHKVVWAMETLTALAMMSYRSLLVLWTLESASLQFKWHVQITIHAYCCLMAMSNVGASASKVDWGTGTPTTLAMMSCHQLSEM